jgi:hypothetical protein
VKHVFRDHGQSGVASFVCSRSRTAQVSSPLVRDSESVTTDEDVSAGSDKGLSVSVREARLKAECADEYPGLTPDVWIPATELAQKLIERAHARRREGRHTRTFDPTHFEFRGGTIGARPRGSRTRKTDRSGREQPTSSENQPGL